MLSHVLTCLPLLVGNLVMLTNHIVSGNDDSTACAGHTNPFPFPPASMRKLLLVDDQLVCRNLNCRICARAKGPEWIAIHTDCYHLYRSCAKRSESKAHDLLFMIASWRNPWTGAEPIYLDPGINQAELIKVSEKFQLPHLQKLPMELLDMIRKEQPHVPFWRFQFVISLSPSIKLP